MSELLQHVVDALSLGSIYALLGLGIALVFGILRLVNFAHGELVMVGAYTAILASGTSFIMIIPLMLVVPMVLAVVLERVAFRPLRGANEMTLLVGSFAVSYLLQNLALIIFGANPRSMNLATAFGESIEVGGLSVPKLSIVTIGVSAVLIALLTAFLNFTRLGVQVRAAAEDFNMARILGVRANRVIASAFCLSGLLAGAAAFLLLGQTGTVYPGMGQVAILGAFVATVIGGMDSLVGAVAGGLLLGFLTIGLEAYLPSSLKPYEQAFAYIVVIAVLIGRPGGLFVPKTSRTRV